MSLAQDKCEELEGQISNLKKEISSIDNTSRRSLEKAAEDTEFKVSPSLIQLTVVILSSRRVSPNDLHITNKMGNLRIQSRHRKRKERPRQTSSNTPGHSPFSIYLHSGPKIE